MPARRTRTLSLKAPQARGSVTLTVTAGNVPGSTAARQRKIQLR